MSTGLHKDLASAEIHTIAAWVYADAAARTGATGFVATDLYKVAYQQSDSSVWVLVGYSPITWIQLASGGSTLLNKVEITVKKNTTGTLTKGQAVYAASWDTANDLALCELARANSASTLPVCGIISEPATEAVAGKVLLLGILHDVDTSSMVAGAPTYCSAATAGVVTTTPPSGPYVVQALGVCLKSHATEGHLGVNILSYRAIQYTTPPADIGDSAACGTSNQESASDHVHAFPFSTLTEKTTPANADLVVIEDSADSNHKKKVQIVNLPAPKSSLMWGNGGVSSTTTERWMTPGWDSALAPVYVLQFRIPMAGTLRNLYVHHNTPAGNGNNIVYTVRKNGVATTLTCTLASTAADGNDTTHTVAVAQGDLLDIWVTKALSIGTSPSDIFATLEVV